MELRKFSLKWEREREGLLLVKWLKWGRGRAFRLLCEKVHWLSFLRVFILWSLNFYVHIINEKSFLPGFVLQFRLNTHTHTQTHTRARANILKRIQIISLFCGTLSFGLITLSNFKDDQIILSLFYIQLEKSLTLWSRWLTEPKFLHCGVPGYNPQLWGDIVYSCIMGFKFWCEFCKVVNCTVVFMGQYA